MSSIRPYMAGELTVARVVVGEHAVDVRPSGNGTGCLGAEAWQMRSSSRVVSLAILDGEDEVGGR